MSVCVNFLSFAHYKGYHQDLSLCLVYFAGRAVPRPVHVAADGSTALSLWRRDIPLCASSHLLTGRGLPPGLGCRKYCCCAHWRSCIFHVGVFRFPSVYIGSEIAGSYRGFRFKEPP